MRSPMSPTLRRMLPVMLLAAATAGCGDDLSAPDSQSCDLQLAVPVTAPATVEYGVDADNAVVASVTFTTPAGDSTITSFPDQNESTFTFDRTVEFTEATDATVQATGEAGTGGAIVVGYFIIPADAGQNPVSDFRACQG